MTMFSSRAKRSRESQLSPLNISLIFGLLITITALPGEATEYRATASATISRILSITQTSPMAFGEIVVSQLGGAVSMDTEGQTSTSVGDAQPSGPSSAAEFSVSGDPNSALDISFSKEDQLTGPEAPLLLSTFKHDAGGSPALGSDGTLSIKIGASLTVGTNQPAGGYSGQYTVSINYQ